MPFGVFYSADDGLKRALMKKKLLKELHVLGRETEKIHMERNLEFVQHTQTSALGWS